MASTVYFTKNITPDALVTIYNALKIKLSGRIGVKVSTGEVGNSHYLQPSLIGKLVKNLNGTIVECNVAYAGGRDQTERHLTTARDHGFFDIGEVDIMDATGEIEIPINPSGHLPIDIVGQHIENYDSFLNLAHYKGHEMAGFGGVLKNQSIGFASASGKAYIHTAGRLRNPAEFMAAFDSPENAARILPTQDVFLECIAETAKAIADYVNNKATNGEPRLAYINVINNLSRDCDCSADPEAPCMADIGIIASLDPVAADQASLDLIRNCDDPGRDKFVQRVEAQNGEHLLEYAAQIGLGNRNYEIIELD